jgi:GDP-mannose 6-dehydrogenase
LDRAKVELLEAGRSPIIEPGLDSIIHSAVDSGRLRFTEDPDEAVSGTELSLVCVGTPSLPNGGLDLRYVRNVVRQIGAALAKSTQYHGVVIRSSILPGTGDNELVPLLEQFSGRPRGAAFGVVVNPEFMREGSAVHDFYCPSQIVIGELDARSGDLVRDLYAFLTCPILRTNIATAEAVKYVSNAFHALKITFANEIGSFCKEHGIDSRDVMDIFRRDRALNVSEAYLRPGFAFGGSCLPKDLRALLYRAKERDLDLPLLGSILRSNSDQIERSVALVERHRRKRIGVLGLTFKPGTDDVRESPVVALVERLIGKGYRVSIYDRNLDLSNIIGANRHFLLNELPHIADLMRSSIEAVVAESDVIVIANNDASFAKVDQLATDGQVVIDLVGLDHGFEHTNGRYHGVYW